MGNSRQNVEARKRFLTTLRERVWYLPGAGAPEEMLASDAQLIGALVNFGIQRAAARDVVASESSGGAKSRLYGIASRTGIDFEILRGALVERWSRSGSKSSEEVKEILDNLQSLKA